MRSTLVLLVVFTGSSTACSGGSENGVTPDPVPASPGQRQRPEEAADPPASATDEPDRFACGSDADCVATYDSDREPCCEALPGGIVYTRAYVQWRQAWMEAHCADAECPDEPTPPPPVACRLEAQCRDGRCENTCSD